ncbi:YHS domain-containing protein (plasmid) [Burkholderia thailandensis]|uniref:YHS domain-containing protein n=1 Tax=Burkholderia thailandensis TaxID=57975 RepID=UPI00192E13EE|nr:YHS domain-containing protein [Burkholderia thailandensis]MBS2132156.1 YHS domain-containing protein [Burkholderia thailandensis]QRA15259.1 YHS domain-containing protein [Burkholderia thailandensis]
MQWLSQNWIWIALAIGVFFMMRHHGGMGYGMGSRHRHGSHRAYDGGDSGSNDPVSGKPVDLSKAVTTQFDGRTYYFESEQSRAEFNKDPERFARTGTRRRHGGC